MRRDASWTSRLALECSIADVSWSRPCGLTGCQLRTCSPHRKVVRPCRDSDSDIDGEILVSEQ
jgi:hypothetical protein